VNFDTELNGTATTNGGLNGAPSTASNNAVYGMAGNTLTVTFNPLNGTLAVGAALGSTVANAAPSLSGGNGNGFGPGGGMQANGTDATTYLTTGTGSVTMTFSNQQMYLGILWGSVDTYNTLTFYENGTSVGSISGTDVLGSAADGNQGPSGTAYVNINSSLNFNSVVATSTTNAFEFDNVAYNASNVIVPEPSTFVVAALGALGMIGYGWRRKGLRVISR